MSQSKEYEARYWYQKAEYYKSEMTKLEMELGSYKSVNKMAEVLSYEDLLEENRVLKTAMEAALKLLEKENV